MDKAKYEKLLNYTWWHARLEGKRQEHYLKKIRELMGKETSDIWLETKKDRKGEIRFLKAICTKPKAIAYRADTLEQKVMLLLKLQREGKKFNSGCKPLHYFELVEGIYGDDQPMWFIVSGDKIFFNSKYPSVESQVLDLEFAQ